MAKIINITALEILDSRGIPAIEVTVYLDDGSLASASSATETYPPVNGLRDRKDNDEKHFKGYGQIQTLNLITNEIKPKIIGQEANDQREIDRILMHLDNTPTKEIIGANTLLSISIAVAKASSNSKKTPLYKHLQEIIGINEEKIPTPIFTIIDGGRNANYSTDFHEFCVVPASFKSFYESLEMGVNIHNAIKEILLRENILPFVGEKGGFGPILSTNEDALILINEGLELINIRLGYDVYLGIDSTANSFTKEGYYKIKDRATSLHTSELVDFYKYLTEKYHILYLEDPLSDNDNEGWMSLFMALNSDAVIAGDYYTISNPLRIQTALEKKTINAIVIKPSFIGTVTESLAVASIAKLAGLKTIISDRTGETNETFLADFAVGVQADYIRFGAPVRGERVAKYNRMLQIANDLQVKK